MTVKKTQQTLSTTLEKTEQNLNGLETALENNVGGRATGEHSEVDEKNAGLPEGWCIATLEDIADWGAGGTPSRKNADYYGGDIPWVKTGDLGPRYVIAASEFITEDAVKNSSAKFFPKGSVAIAMYGATIGKTSILGIDATTNQACAVGNPIDGVTSTDYLYYFLRNEKDAFIAKGKGGAQPNISQALIKAHELYLPPLAEQTVIAQTLDTLLAQVDNIKTRLDAIPKILKTFRQSVLAAAVSGKLTEAWRGENECVITERDILDKRFVNWCDEKLAEFSLKGKKQKNELWKNKYTQPELVENDKIWPIPEKWCWSTIDAIAKVTKLAGFEFTKHVNYTEDGDLPVIKAENVGVNGYRHKCYSYVKSEDVETLSRSELTGREILIVFVGAGVGQVGISPDDRKYFLGPNVAVVKQASNLYSPEYLELYLRSLSGKEILLSFSKGGAQPSLSMGQIRKTSIPIPPVSEQTEIVRRVEELFAFADQIEQQVKNAQGRVNNLTQSILAKAFRGELTAQWRAENPNLISGENSAEALLAKIQAEREKLSPIKATKKKSTAKKTTRKKTDA